MDSSTLTTLLDTVSQGVVVFGADRQIVYCNQAFLDITGFDRSEMADALCGIMQGYDTDCAAIAAIDAAIEARQAFSGDVRSYRKSGETFWNELSFRPLPAGPGEAARFIGYSRDVTARKLAQTRVTELERDYEFIAENVLSGTTMVPPNAIAAAIRAAASGAAKEVPRSLTRRPLASAPVMLAPGAA